MQTGAINLVSTSSSGVQANGYSSETSVSTDGRYVVFGSEANNLVAGDTNGAGDIFIKDIQTGVTSRVSTSSVEVQANDTSYGPSVSADGRYVVFASFASNLVAGDTNGFSDIFVKDTQTGTLSRVSTSSAGVQANCDNLAPAISADGRYVVFASNASNLAAGDTTNGTDIYIKNMQTGAISLISKGEGGSGCAPSINSNGRYVVFRSAQPSLVPNDGNGKFDIFLMDMQTSTISRVTTSSTGAEANDDSDYSSSISADGRYVVFGSLASNLVAGDTNGTWDIFLKDMQTGAISLISRNSTTQGNGGSSTAKISADGKYVSFVTTSSNLVANDTNNTYDVFLADTSLLSSLTPLTGLPPVTPPVCFTKGTLIATSTGERLVETLAIGDTVTLAHGGSAAIKWIGRQSIPLSHALTDESLPVLIRAGALGENIPTQDLYVSPDHAMLFDGTLIHARALINGDSIIQLGSWSGDLEYYHIETDRHEIILANGAPAETFIDNESRQRFDNAAEYEALYPKERPMRELQLPRVKFRRQLSRITSGLLDRRAVMIPPFHARAA